MEKVESLDVSMKTEREAGRANKIEEERGELLEITNREMQGKVLQGRIVKPTMRKNIMCIDFMQHLDLRIDSEKVLFFDMDGVLVDTNLANFLSYQKAIAKIKPDVNISYESDERFNRETLNKVVSNLAEMECQKIIQLKNKFYVDFLSETKLNELAMDILSRYCKTNKTVLVTNCRKGRAYATLGHYGLIDKFSRRFYRQETENEGDNNKYRNALLRLKVTSSSVLVFENEKSEMNAAINAGIPIENIIGVPFTGYARISN